MKTRLLFTFLICLVGFGMNAQEGERYMVRHIKFKKGMADKAMEVGMKYFNGSAKNLGKDVMVLRFVTGPWDAIVFDPIQPEDTINKKLFNEDGEGWREMIKIAGSEEKLLEVIKVYGEAVEKEEITFANRVSEH